MKTTLFAKLRSYFTIRNVKQFESSNGQGGYDKWAWLFLVIVASGYSCFWF